MSGLCRQWTENFDTSFDRRLTARPVVLVKTYEPGTSCSRREVMFRARRSITGVNDPQEYDRRGQAMPAALARAPRLEVEADSIRLRPADFAR